ncbi:MAG: hypothetical protein Ta2A_02410 [Treponemataceae bacterium]|nr:MAG: hypothetical protein Ta2A_02410 [Treponemataceae bacterium]
MEENARFEHIETKLMYMENTLQQLEKVAAEQARQIEKLFAENAFLKAKLKEMQEDGGYIPNTKPPHY